MAHASTRTGLKPDSRLLCGVEHGLEVDGRNYVVENISDFIFSTIVFALLML